MYDYHGTDLHLLIVRRSFLICAFPRGLIEEHVGLEFT